MDGNGAHFRLQIEVRKDPIFFITSTGEASAGVFMKASSLK
jgi:hypothetical protein